jgi:hypothetical protein
MSSSGVAILILPLLVSGFLFCVIQYQVRFWSAKLDGQRLFFLAAAIGLFFALVSAQIYPFIRAWLMQWWPANLPSPTGRLSTVLPADSPGALVLTVLLSAAVALALNLIYSLRPYKWGVRYVSGWGKTIEALVPAIGDPLQQLLVRAVQHQKKVQVSLQSGRVYIGFVYRTPQRPHVESAYIEILTEYSLFRNEKGKFPKREEWSVYPGAKVAELKGFIGTLEETIETIGRLKELPAESRAKVNKLLKDRLAAAKSSLDEVLKRTSVQREDWIRVLPVSEIESVGFFDEDVYRWFATSSAASRDGSPSSPSELPAEVSEK